MLVVNNMNSVFLVKMPKILTALCQFVKVQDPDNSSQTVYDSWIKSSIPPQVSCCSLLIQQPTLYVVLRTQLVVTII
jgi:hypothetical protein